jgi:HK97 family phage prohead protease
MTSKASPPSLIHKSLGVQGCKVLSAEEGIVEAFVSGIGNKDSVGDIIQPGAFNKFLKYRKPKGVWSHDWDKPISKTLEMYEVPSGDKRLPLKMQLAGIGGLYVKTQFNLNTQLGRDAYETVKFFGDEAEWSIGYQVHDQEFDKKQKAMLLKEIELFEYSPVLFGANELTSTVSIKAHRGENGELEVDVDGLEDVESKAIKAALDVILKEKSVTLTDVEVENKNFWHVEERSGEYCVINHELDTVEECFSSEEDAYSKMAELYASESANEEVLPSIDGGVSKSSEEELDAKADAADLSRGTLVRWNSSGGMAYGQVVSVVRNGTVNAEPNGPSMEGTEDNPAIRVRVWEFDAGDWRATDTITVHRSGSLTIIEELPASKELDHEFKAISDVNLMPTDSMVASAVRGLEWRREFNRGGTAIGVARARDIANRKELSPETVRRMKSYFARHEVDKQAEGFSSGEDGFPSAGRIAWELWGGDSGASWSERKVAELEREAEKEISNEEFDNKVEFDTQEDAKMAEISTEGQKAYSVYQNGELFMVVDDATGEVCKWFTNMDMAELYAAKENAEEQAEMAEAAYEAAEDAAGMASEGEMETDSMYEDEKSVEEKVAIQSHSTATSTSSWDGPENEARAKSGETPAYYRNIYAWRDPDGDPSVKASYRFIHHEVDASGDPGTANVQACRTGIGVLNGGRGGTTIPDADREGVYNHLARHLRDAGVEPPTLKSLEEIENESIEDSSTVSEIELVDEKIDDIDLSTKAGRVLAERHVAALRKAADEIMVVLAACDDAYEKSEETTGLELDVKEIDSDVESIEEKSDESSEGDAEVDDSPENEVSDVENAEDTSDSSSETDETEEDSDAEIVNEVDEKSDDSEIEVKEIDEEDVEEKSDNEEVNDVDFIKNLAEFEEIISDEI